MKRLGLFFVVLSTAGGLSAAGLWPEPLSGSAETLAFPAAPRLESMASPGWAFRALYDNNSVDSAGWAGQGSVLYRYNEFLTLGVDLGYENYSIVSNAGPGFFSEGYSPSNVDVFWFAPSLGFGFWPLRRLNIHFEASAGPFSMDGSQTATDAQQPFFNSKAEYAGDGILVGLRGGVDFYFTRNFSLGVGLRLQEAVASSFWQVKDNNQSAFSQDVGAPWPLAFGGPGASVGLTYWWAPVPATGPLIWKARSFAQRKAHAQRMAKRARKRQEAAKAYRALAILEPAAWGLRLSSGGLEQYPIQMNPFMANQQMPSGPETGVSLWYRFSPRWQAGFEADYLNASSSYQMPSATNASADCSFHAPFLWLGPEARVAFWTGPALDFHFGLGIDYLQTVGAYYTYYATLPTGLFAAEPSTVRLEAQGLGGQAFFGADYHFGTHYSLGLDIGGREAYFYGPSQNLSGLSNTSYNGPFSEFYSNLGLTYWF